MSSRNGEAVAAPAVEKPVLSRLKPGPGLSRQAAAMDQKCRLRFALSELAAESGYKAVTVRALIHRANISTSTFYNHYDSVADCLAGIVGSTIRTVATDIRQRQELDGNAIEGLRIALRLLMDRLAREPQIARSVFIESVAAGPRVLDELGSALDELETLVAQIFALAPRPAAGTTHLAIGLVAAIMGVIRRTTLAGRVGELPGLADELTDWMLSVAHEEVVVFFGRRSHDADRGIAHRLPRSGGSPVASPVDRAITVTVDLAAADGLAGLTSAKIRREAGLSQGEFDRHFGDIEECYLAAVEWVSANAAALAERHAGDAENWERWTCKVVAELCSLAAENQDLARLVLLDITDPGCAGLIRREKLIGCAAERIREQASPARRPSELAAIASVSAIWRIAEGEVAARRTEQLTRIAPVFVYMILAATRRQGHSPTRQSPELTFGTRQVAVPSYS